ncbi:MAG: cyclic nucleotide-binding domain-containing protein [Verrucomicrobiae bacterium]|nr:cyclic nucleotide-binding domain-containing protein [Verrucomicrobiae bacterium]
MSLIDNNAILIKSSHIEERQLRHDRILLKQTHRLQYAALTRFQMALLDRFDGRKTVAEVLAGLFQSGEIKSPRVFYDLVVSAREKGFLEVTQTEFSRVEHPKAVSMGLVSFLVIGLVYVLGAYAFAHSALDPGAHVGFWVFVLVGATVATSLGSVMAAMTLGLWGRSAYKPSIDYSRGIPRLAFDTHDSFMGGRACDTAVALAGLAGPMMLAFLTYFFHAAVELRIATGEGIVNPLAYASALIMGAWLALIIESAPFGNTWGLALVRGIFRSRVDLPRQSPFAMGKNLIQRLIRSGEDFQEERYFIAYSTALILWLGFVFQLGAVFVASQFYVVTSTFLLEKTLGLRFYFVLVIMGLGLLLLVVPVVFLLWIFAYGFVREILEKAAIHERKWKKQRHTHGEPDTAQKVQFISQNVLFAGLDSERVRRVAEVCRFARVGRGKQIVRQGEPGDSFFMVWNGRVEVFGNGFAGQATAVAHLGGGDSFGERALLDNAPRVATIRAETDCELLVLSRGDFQSRVVDASSGADEIRQRVEMAGFLRRVDLFADWHPQAILTLLRKVTLETFPAGQTLIRQGEENRHFYLVFSGSVKIFKDGVEVAVLSSGQFCGEISLMQGIPATADVVTREETRCFVFSKEQFLEIVTKDFLTGYVLDRKAEQRTGGSR